MKIKKLVKNIQALVLLVIATFFCISIVKAEDLIDGQVYVGYGKANIDPIKNGEVIPVPMEGYGNPLDRLATDINGSLYATAVVMKDSNNEHIVFVTLDLLSVKEALVEEIREYVSSSTTIDKNRIMLSSTHTHSAPDTTQKTDTISEYKKILKDGILSAIKDGINDLKPADIYINSTNVLTDSGNNALNFVRHYNTINKDKEGNPIYRTDNHGLFAWGAQNKWINTTRSSHISKADSELQMIKFDFKDVNDKDLLMVNWQSHPHLFGSSTSTTISSDIIGTFRDKVEEELGYRVAYYNGAGGNINPLSSLTDGSVGIENISYFTKTIETSEKVKNHGQKLAEYVIKSYNNFKRVNGGNIRIETKNISLENRSPSDYSNEIIVNAKYCYKIRSYAKEIIEGKYDWGTFEFYDGFIFDKEGNKLREIIQNNESLLDDYKITYDEETGYTVGSDINVSAINRLVALIGMEFDEKIYSIYHASAIIRHSNYEESQKTNVEINAVSIGDISFATAPFEMFDVQGKYIKYNAISQMTFILGYSNGSNGYLPSQSAFEYGSYETDTTNFKKGTAEKLANELVFMVDRINTYTITIEPNENVIVDESGVITVIRGDNKTFKIISKENFKITNITVNNISQKLPLKNDTLTLNNITEDTRIIITVQPTESTNKEETNLDEFIENPKTGVERVKWILFVVTVVITVFFQIVSVSKNSDKENR